MTEHRKPQLGGSKDNGNEGCAWIAIQRYNLVLQSEKTSGQKTYDKGQKRSMDGQTIPRDALAVLSVTQFELLTLVHFKNDQFVTP